MKNLITVGILTLLFHNLKGQDCDMINNFTALNGILLGRKVSDEIKDNFRIKSFDSSDNQYKIINSDKSKKRKLFSFFDIMFDEATVYTSKENIVYTVVLSKDFSIEENLELERNGRIFMLEELERNLKNLFGTPTEKEKNSVFPLVILYECEKIKVFIWLSKYDTGPKKGKWHMFIEVTDKLAENKSKLEFIKRP